MVDQAVNLVKKLTTYPLVRFALVGGVATVVHVSIYSLLFIVFSVHAQIANGTAWVFAAAYSYAGQRFWTFQHVSVENESLAFMRFIVSSLISLASNAAFAQVFTYQYPNTYLAIAGMAFVTPILTFLLMKYWAFKRVD
ncbi:Uncharacterised protein [BD1-7 clade bacterium]|uniref:GtrA/DPMS transmembrane domain-containing protein n=1 Tax=BD1-7 clade bacterium TaxID=2029982 RepID=A0A5S9PLZ7_9GAMM|nr:Uncharacterised protein [BD1-7 clade bacterium]